MTIGVQLFASRRDGAATEHSLRDLVQKALLAEQCGYDVVWLAEHHNSDWNLCSDPLTVLAHLAAATNRIRLGAAVVNLNLHHPVRIAEQAALVNALSGGRLELGIGRGFAPADYDLFGVDQRDSDRLFRTHHERLIDHMGSDAVTREIPVWLATTGSQQSLDLAVRHGHGLLVAAHGSKLAKITDYAHARAPQLRVALARAVHVAASTQVAEREVRPYLAWYIEQLARLQPGALSPALNDVVNTFCVLGTDQECRRKLRALCAEYGVTDFIGVFGIGGMEPATAIRALQSFIPAHIEGGDAKPSTPSYSIPVASRTVFNTT